MRNTMTTYGNRTYVWATLAVIVGVILLYTFSDDEDETLINEIHRLQDECKVFTEKTGMDCKVGTVVTVEAD